MQVDGLKGVRGEGIQAEGVQAEGFGTSNSDLRPSACARNLTPLTPSACVPSDFSLNPFGLWSPACPYLPFICHASNLGNAEESLIRILASRA